MAIQGSEVLCRADPPQRWAWARSKSACAEDLQQEIVAQPAEGKVAHTEEDGPPCDSLGQRLQCMQPV